MHIDDILIGFNKIEGALQESTCNIRKTGALLVLQDKREYLTTNGSKVDPCTKEPDRCDCQNSLPVLDYATCRSFCAEGYALRMARKSDDLIGGTILTTSLPCVRCTDLIIDNSLNELYFRGFRAGEMRFKDMIYIAKMNASGIKVFEVRDGNLLKHEFPKEIQQEAMALYPPMPGLWMRLEEDIGFRERQKEFLSWLKKNWGYSSSLPERRVRS